MTGLSRAPRLEPEDDEGSVEYKWRLNPQSLGRQESLATQMKFRLGEGGGVCTYFIGYRDDGEPKGLMESELDSSLQTLERIASSVGASVTVLEVYLVDARPKTKKQADPASKGDGHMLYCAHCEVKLLSEALPGALADSPVNPPFLGRVAFVGLSGVGKTTLIGAIVSETRDDGRGSLRFSTSKLVHEVLNGGVTCAATSHFFESSFGLIELLDLPAPMDRYRKTLYKALVTKPIDLIVLVMDSTAADNMDTSSLEWTHGLDVPILRVLTKGDLKKPVHSGSSPPPSLAAADHWREALVVSAVTGTGLERVKESIVSALRSVKAGLKDADVAKEEGEEVVLSIDEAWTKEDRLVVVGGVLETGHLLKTGMVLRLQCTRRVSELCKIVDIRDESGKEQDTFDQVGRYCTLGIVALSTEEISTCSSSGELLRGFKRVRPPAILSSQLLQFVDCFCVKFKDPLYPLDSIKEGHCMVYWRGDRQQAKISKYSSKNDDDLFQIQLTKRTGFFPHHMKVIIETLPKGPVYVGKIHHP